MPDEVSSQNKEKRIVRGDSGTALTSYPKGMGCRILSDLFSCYGSRLTDDCVLKRKLS